MCSGSGQQFAQTLCSNCGGSGSITRWGMVDGSGQTVRERCSCSHGYVSAYVTCRLCSGIGVVPVSASGGGNVSPAVIARPDKPLPPPSILGTMLGMVLFVVLLPFRCFPLGFILGLALLPEGCRNQIGDYLEKHSPPPKPRVLHPENPMLRSYP